MSSKQSRDFSAVHKLAEPGPLRPAPKALDSAEALWDNLKAKLKSQFKGRLLDSVLNVVTLTPTRLGQKAHITLKVPSLFHQNFLKTRLAHILSQMDHPSIKVHFFLSKAPLSRLLDKKAMQQSPSDKISTKKPVSQSSLFHPDWTFSSFIEGPGNIFAFSLAQSIVKAPFKNSSNPLFIYGPSGLGKTHLLHAIGNALAEERPQLKVLYLSAERFFNDCISHIRRNEMSLFRKKYRKNIQVLLLDDIPILGRGESTQEEFFHTYESLKQAGCQVVLTSDQRPKSIQGLKTRIRTRFEGGVVADIQAPDKDTRKAIIKLKSSHKGLKMPEDVVSYMANMSISSVRELEGHINKVKMFCELRGQSLSLSLVKQIFAKDLFVCSREEQKSKCASPEISPAFALKVRQIQKRVCAHFHLSLAVLRSSSREKSVVRARNMAIYLMREHLNMTLHDIGAFMGGRSHSTLLNSLKNMQKSLSQEPHTLRAFQELKKSLKASLMSEPSKPLLDKKR